MVTWGSALAQHCKGIESVIEVERQRLQSAKDQLKQYERNSFVDEEREESRRREDQIRWCKKQVSSLKREYDTLRREIADAESRKLDESIFNQRRRSLKVVAAEIDSCKVEIDKFDKKLRELREANENIEKDQEKKFREFHANHGFIMKPRSSGCLQLGRLMVEEEDAKQALNLVNSKKTRLTYMIRELEKSLIIAEKECNLREDNLRMKESQELERNIALIENSYVRQKEIKDDLEFRAGKARTKLHLLEMAKSPSLRSEIQEIRKSIAENKILADNYRLNIKEMNLIASTLHEDLLEVTRRNNQFAEKFMKKYEEAMREVSVDVHKIKAENAELDARIENVRKFNSWAKKNYETKVVEHEESDVTGDQRLLTRYRLEEDEAKCKLQKLNESCKKLKEHVENLLDILFNAQLQCFTKERLLEEIQNGLWEVKTCYLEIRAEILRERIKLVSQDKNIADVNAWLTKKMSVFKPSKENEKLLIRIPRRTGQRSEIPRRTADVHNQSGQKPCQKRDENALKTRDEMDHYRLRAKQLRDEFNALYKDLVTFRRDKSEFYENFAKQNVDALVQMIYEIHRAEDEILSLEEEIGVCVEEKKPKEVVLPVKVEPEPVIRSPQEEAQEILKTLKEITGKLKEQLASVHNYVASLSQESGNREKHGDQPSNNSGEIKKERMRRYDCLLKNLGIKPH